MTILEPARASAKRLRRFGCGLILFCAILGGAYLWFGVLEPIGQWRQWHNRMGADIKLLASKRPPDITREEWEWVVSWTNNLHGNCGSWWTNFNSGEMQPFTEEFERRLQGPVDMKTIDWIWDEYARLTKNGKKYSDKYRPTDRQWSQWYFRVQADIKLLASKRPPDITRGEWEWVVGWTLNLHRNCGSEWTNFDSGEMQPLAEELERRLQGPVDMKTIDWIWDEYASLTKNGKKYSDKNRPTDPEQYKLATEGCFGIKVD